LLTHEEHQYPEDGSGPGAVSLKSEQGMNQTWRNTVEPSLEQSHPITPKTGSGTGFRIGSGTGSRIIPEPV